MANTDTRFGLQPIRHISGAPYNGSTRPYYVSASYATALFIGDPVIKVSSGSNAATITVPGVGEMPPGTLPAIEVAAAGGPVTGAIVAFAAVDGALDVIKSPGSTEAVAFVCDDHDVIFKIQEASGGTALAAADVGLNCSFVAGAGSAATGMSGYELDNTTELSTAGLELKIIALHNITGNAIGEHAVWEVKINDHTMPNVTAGI